MRIGKGGLWIAMTGIALAAGCGPEYPNCDSDSDCREGEFCVNNICARCRSDTDCTVGQECRDGACRDIPGYCDSDRRCPMSRVCRSNRCSPCASDAECGPGLVCVNGACSQPAECDASRPCQAGDECVNGRCRPVGAGDVGGCQYTSIYFDFDRDNVRRDQRDAAAASRNCMDERSATVRLVGFCDERGTSEYNMALGERRATAVRRYLNGLGVPRSRIRDSLSRGSTEARHCFQEDCWQQDRRVDFRE